MITDDARTVDAKACQLETWQRVNRDNREYWALPACNFSGNLELTGGGGVEWGDGNRTTDVVLQGKTLFKPLATNGYGIGLVVGTVRHPAINTGSNSLGDAYAYAPTSFSFADDRVVVHTNLGAQYAAAAGHLHATWGIGSEIQVSNRAWVIGETFGRSQERSWFQVGLRYWIVPERVQIDTTYGNGYNLESSGRWISIGLRLLTPAFLP